MKKLLLIATFVGLALSAAAVADDKVEAKGKKVEFEVYKPYFEKNNSGLKGEPSYIALTSREAFDKVFGPAAVMKKQTFLPKDAFDKQIVISVIKRGTTLWTYTVEKVTVDDDTLYVQYEATGADSKTATYKSPLIVAVDKGKLTSVVFIENGKKVGTAKIE